jgi:hypothetical protein
MADIVFDSVLTDISSADIDFGVDTFKIMLVTSAYVPNQATHNRRDDVTNELATAGGYTAGGATIACTPSTAPRERILTFAVAAWATATFSTAGAVIYKARGGASSADEIICYLDFGGTVTGTGSTFSVSATTITITNNV